MPAGRTCSHAHSGAVRRQGPRTTQKRSAQYEGADGALRRQGRRTPPVESAHCAKIECALRKKEVRTPQKRSAHCASGGAHCARTPRTASSQCAPTGAQCDLRGLACPSGLVGRTFLQRLFFAQNARVPSCAPPAGALLVILLATQFALPTLGRGFGWERGGPCC